MPPDRATGQGRAILWAILALALLLRLGHLALPFTPGPGRYPDAFGNVYYFFDDYEYSMLAVGLLEGKGFIWWDGAEGNYFPEFLRGQTASIRPPGYPFFLAGIYAIFGVRSGPVIAIQILLSVWLCLVVRDIALALAGGDRRVGWAAAAAAALWPGFIFYSRALLGETLYVFLVALFIARRLRPNALWRDDVWDGLLLGLACLVRAPAFWFPPVLLVIERLLGRRWSGTAVVWAVTLAVVLPWTLRNWAVTGRLEPVCTGGSIAFFQGNWPGRDQGGHVFDAEIDHLVGERTPPHERGPVLMREALRWMRSSPAAAAKKWVEKALWFWYPFDGSLYGLRRFNLTYGLCLGLMIPGLWALGRRWRELAPAWGFVCFYFGIHVVVQSLTRYRLVVEPVLIAVAALGLVRLVEARRWATLAIILAANGALYLAGEELQRGLAAWFGR